MATYDGMMGTGREQITDYKKEAMMQLSEDVHKYHGRFDELLTSVANKIAEMEQYWVKNDSDAQALYTTLKGNFTTFKGKMDTGSELIDQFKKRIDGQVDNYLTAEQEARRAINSAQ